MTGLLCLTLDGLGDLGLLVNVNVIIYTAVFTSVISALSNRRRKSLQSRMFSSPPGYPVEFFVDGRSIQHHLTNHNDFARPACYAKLVTHGMAIMIAVALFENSVNNGCIRP